jgi:flagellar hook assembly protein FlgD
VSITIYDVAGTPVRNISVGYLEAGKYVSQSRAIYWDGKTDSGESVASGTYFYTLTAEDYTSTQKMIILK